MELNSFLNFLPLDALLIGSAFIYWKVNRVSLQTVFPAQDWKKTILSGFFLFLLLLVSSIVISQTMSVLGLDDSDKVSDTLQQIANTSPWLIIYLLAVRVVAEEIFFRSFLTREIGFVPAAVVFGIAHTGYGSFVQIIGATVLGLILGWHFQKNQNVGATWMAHVLYNSIILLVLFVA